MQSTLPCDHVVLNMTTWQCRNPESSVSQAPTLKKTRSGGIRALCQRSLSQAFGQGKAEA